MKGCWGRVILGGWWGSILAWKRPAIQEVPKTIGSLSWMGSVGRLFTENAGIRVGPHLHCCLVAVAASDLLDSGINGTVIVVYLSHRLVGEPVKSCL